MHILRRIFLGLFVSSVFIACAALPPAAFAQTDPAEDSAAISEGLEYENDIVHVPDEYFRARIISISDVVGGAENGEAMKEVVVELREKSLKGTRITIVTGESSAFTSGTAPLRTGETIVVGKSVLEGETTYYIADRYRLPALAGIAAVFLVLVVALSRKKGVASVIGLAVTVVVLLGYLVPQLLAGKNPLVVTFFASLMVTFTSLYLAHGWNRRTHVAVGSTLLTLLISVGMARTFVGWARLMGLGSEDAFLLMTSLPESFDFRGLLLGGIILGTLGVLDDVTTGQAAIVDELVKANPKMSFVELYRSAISVGKEHISSLVNTLFLAYAGVSLPLFMLFSLGSGQPLWLSLNGEFIAEEVVRTLTGSIVLVAAVPITTLFAAALLRPRGARLPS